ncbi:uncharacterized protein LOC144746993 [Ciona intestinalis]
MGDGCNEPCVNGSQVVANSGECTCHQCYAGVGCNSECSGNGQCSNDNNACVCNAGYWGDKCEVTGCPGVGVSCSGHGSCNPERQICTCDEGYSAPGCSDPDCPGEPNCNGNGVCSTEPYYLSMPDQLDIGQIVVRLVTIPHCVDCLDGWYGTACGIRCVNGTVSSNGESCICHPCYSGLDCDIECSNNGHCDADLDVCVCDNTAGDAWVGEKCEYQGCPGVDGSCNGNGMCSATSSICECFPGWTGEDCGTPSCPDECNNHGECMDTIPRHCRCSAEWGGEFCDQPCVNGTNVDGTRCVCDACYSGVGCNSICSGFGECQQDSGTNELYCRCFYELGYKGSTCSVPGCPGWPLDCSGHGDCNLGSMECECSPGWKGVACHVPDCGGSPDCLGRGVCQPPLSLLTVPLHLLVTYINTWNHTVPVMPHTWVIVAN